MNFRDPHLFHLLLPSLVWSRLNLKQIGRVRVGRGAQIAHAHAYQAKRPAIGFPLDHRGSVPNEDIRLLCGVCKTEIAGEDTEVMGLEFQDQGAAGDITANQSCRDTFAQGSYRLA